MQNTDQNNPTPSSHLTSVVYGEKTEFYSILKTRVNAEIPVKYQRDNLSSYLKILFAILEPSNQIIFIDEPETFLHPPQRRALGSLISKLVLEKNKQLFISTHDPDFMRAALSSPSESLIIFNLSNEGEIYSHKE